MLKHDMRMHLALCPMRTDELKNFDWDEKRGLTDREPYCPGQAKCQAQAANCLEQSVDKQPGRHHVNIAGSDRVQMVADGVEEPAFRIKVKPVNELVEKLRKV